MVVRALAEQIKRRKLLAYGAAGMLGTAVLGAGSAKWLPGSTTQTRAPGRVGLLDVMQVEAATRALRALDYQFGGGACRDAVAAQLSWAVRLLGARGKEVVRARLFRALGDLQNLAGWATFDMGLPDSSRSHFATALSYATESGDASLKSNILYRIGRVFLHYGAPSDALKWFELGQATARDSGSVLAGAVLYSNQAWAYAMMGDGVQATTLLGRSGDELARANLAEAPGWATFYNETDMYAMIGTVHTELSAFQVRYAAIAIPALDHALARYNDSMARSRVFTLTMLATNHLRQDDTSHGVQIGRKALACATGLRSQRITDRLKPLELAAAQSSNSDSRELTHLIRHHRNT
jgi:hypothetical protein